MGMVRPPGATNLLLVINSYSTASSFIAIALPFTIADIASIVRVSHTAFNLGACPSYS